MKNTIKIGSLVALLAGITGGCNNPSNNETNQNAKVSGFDLANLDNTVIPCEDFFQYSAGGWIEKNPIPDSEPRWGRFNELNDANNEKIRGILEEFSGKDGLQKGSDPQLIGDLYYSGMDSAKIEADGLKYIQPFLDEVDAITSKSELIAYWANADSKGGSSPVGMYVSPDSKNSSVNFLHFSQTGIGLPDKDYYLKEDSASQMLQEKYRIHLSNMFELYGDDAAEAIRKSQAIYKLEESLAKHMMSRVDRRDPKNTYNKMSFSALNELTPSIDFNAYLLASNISTDSVIVGQPNFYKGLEEVYKTTSLEDWKDYTSWRILSSAANYMPMEFVEERFDFYGRTLRGTKELKPRWKRTLSATNSLSEQLGHLFVEQYFSEESKSAVEQMVEDLRSAYKDRIMGLAWMSDDTKEKALEKLAAFTYKIGYPNKWKDYSDLELSKESFLMNMQALSAYKTQENYAKLKEPVDKDAWFMGAHIVNAYYNPQNNEIVFPAGILQPPFYNPDADDAINYGGIGGVIGHEFTHGFDDQGSKYGADGNLENWWTEEDRERFDTLANRLIAQYDAYEPIEGVNVNGSLTIGENIADLGGLTLAYHAYLKSREGKPELEPVDGFTDKQRVFLGWAQVWQLHATDAYTRNQVNTDPHSPSKYRVNGPMANMPEFEEAFGCSHGGGVAKADEDKIIIW